MAFRELVSPSLTDLFVKEMQRMILSGELKTGDKLPTERELAAKMKVSTSVINGGIQRLTAAGFLTVRPRKGVFVADYVREGNIVTLEALLEYGETHFQDDILSSLVDFRKLYEVDITKEACDKRKQEHLDNMTDLMKKMNETDSPDDLADYAYRFHHEIAIASGGVLHALLIATIRSGYVSSYRTMLESPNRLKAYRAFFEMLYRNILEQDRDAAAETINKSIDEWERAYRTMFVNGQSLDGAQDGK